MESNEMKEVAAKATLDTVLQSLPKDAILGIGTGSTVDCFIKHLPSLLLQSKKKVKGFIASSKETKEKLMKDGLKVFELADVLECDAYIDGANEINEYGEMIKGGSGTLTGAKVLASICKKFYAIVDETKLVSRLGKFPLPIEVAPFARSYVARRLLDLGGDSEYLMNYQTEHGGDILLVEGLNLDIPLEVEKLITSIPGVLTCGLFAELPADYVIIGTSQGARVRECLRKTAINSLS